MTIFGELFASERSYRQGDPEHVLDLRKAWRETNAGLVVLDPGEYGAIQVWRPFRKWPASPYFSASMTTPNVLGLAAQAAAEVDAAVIVSEAGYLNVRQPTSLVTSRRAGIALGAIAAHVGYTMHVVYVPPASWQSVALPELRGDDDSGTRKRMAIEVADAFIPKVLAQAKNAQERSGLADTWGMATWWAISSMIASPIRK